MNLQVKQLLPAVAAFFSCSVVGVGAQYLGLLSPLLKVPFWLWFIMLLASLESAYFASYYLKKRTPALVRIVELVLWLTPVYLLSGRVPRDFWWPGILVFLCWLTARGYGSQMAFMEKIADHLGDQGAATVSWEYESLGDSEAQDAPLRYFWRRLCFFGASIVSLAIAVHSRYDTVAMRDTAGLRFLGSVAVASGLVLQAGAYLFRLQVLWDHAQASVSPTLVRTWMKGAAVFSLLFVLVLNLAPVNYSPITARELGGWVQRFMTQGPSVVMPPLEYQESTSRIDAEQSLEPFQGLTPGPWGVLWIIAILSAILGMTVSTLLLLGFLLAHLVGVEVEKLKGLPRLAVQVYLGVCMALRKLFSLHTARNRSDIPPSGSEASKPLGEGKARRRLKRRGPGPKNIRAMLRRIVHEGEKKGLVFHPVLTASEYGRMLREHLFHEALGIDEFFSGYEMVRYSRHEVSLIEEEHLLAIGAGIIQEIQKLRGDE
jgi:hypothetical protein